jgi:hypothetical protein
MRLFIPVTATLVTAALASAAIIDRTAILVGKRVILDSSIDRDIRITSFLNHESPDFSPASRKKAANRLIDQALIREQIQSGNYPVAPENEVVELLAQIKKERFPTDAQYHRALSQAGITEADLKDRLAWQLTVLRFIDVRFRPAVVVSDEEIQRYYNAHRTELKSSLDEARQKIVDQISGERVNTLLDDWLKETRQQTHIEYLEKSLQ